MALEGLSFLGRRTATCLNRKLLPFSPLGPRPHVDPDSCVPEQIAQRKMDVARLSGTVAVGDDVLVGCDPLRQVTGPQLRQGLPDVSEPLLGQIILPIMVDGSGYVASAHLSAGFPDVLLGG